MDIEVKLDSRFAVPKIVIYTAELSDEINALVRRLGGTPIGNIAGFRGDVATILEAADIIRVYAERQKVFAEGGGEKYLLRLRLYEAEALLDSHNFVRISNSEIINLRKVDSLDLSFTGTICVRLQNGNTAFASRRYVPKIKTMLGL